MSVDLEMLEKLLAAADAHDGPFFAFDQDCTVPGEETDIRWGVCSMAGAHETSEGCPGADPEHCHRCIVFSGSVGEEWAKAIAALLNAAPALIAEVRRLRGGLSTILGWMEFERQGGYGDKATCIHLLQLVESAARDTLNPPPDRTVEDIIRDAVAALERKP